MKSLKVIYCLTYLDLSWLICHLKTLTVMSLGKNQIGSQGSKYLSDALQHNKVIIAIISIILAELIYIYCIGNSIAAMVEWLRCSARIHKVLCSNLSNITHGMTLDKSLTAKLPQMTRPTWVIRTDYIFSQYVGRKRVQIPPSVKRKRRKNPVACGNYYNNRGRPQRAISLWDVIIIIIGNSTYFSGR